MKAYVINTLIAALILGTRAEWHLVWEDEFNGDELNTSEWIVKDDCLGKHSITKKAFDPKLITFFPSSLQ